MGIGKKTAQIIVDAVAHQLTHAQQETFTIYDLESYLCNETFLLGIKGIGPETIASVKQWFSNQHNKDILEQMAEK